MAASIKELCHKLAELGWLFHKIKQYVESRSRDKAFGLVGQVCVCVCVCACACVRARRLRDRVCMHVCLFTVWFAY